MFKKLFLTVALIGIGAASYGVARAYFTTKVPTTETATFSSGTVSIDITNHDGYNAVPFSLTNWMPGQSQDVVFDVKNDSTVPVNIAGAIDGTWGGSLGDKMVNVTDAKYWNGSGWAQLSSSDPHGTFTLVDNTNGIIPAGGLVTLKFTAHFEEAAENDLQGQTYTATLRVVAAQVGGTFPTF